jgi:amidase
MDDGQPHSIPHHDLIDRTIASLTADLASGTCTSRELTQAYCDRINATNTVGPQLRAINDINPDALDIAERLDAERRSGHVRGPLHGIPVLIKENIDTADQMPTTAGSLALLGLPAPNDAGVVKRLREAGAIILGKTNLSEFANFRSTNSSSGWSGRTSLIARPRVRAVARGWRHQPRWLLARWGLKQTVRLCLPRMPAAWLGSSRPSG